MSTQIVYLFDGQTGAHAGTYTAQQSALEPGVFIAPANSTATAPPAATDNAVAVYASGAWTVVADYRGQTIYSQSTGAAEEVTAIGALPSGYALTAPPPTLAQAQVAQLSTLATSFAAASTANVADSSGLIWSGGMSSALSIYGAVQLASASGVTSVTLFDASNAAHALTIAQGTSVAVAIGAAYQTVFAKYQACKVAVAAATTVAAVEAIAWS